MQLCTLISCWASLYKRKQRIAMEKKLSLTQKLDRITQSRFVKYGLPFFILVIGGSFFLQQFTQIRYQFSKKQPVNPEEMKKYGVSMKKRSEVTLDHEYEKIKNLDIDHWENKRGPRPWEE